MIKIQMVKPTAPEIAEELLYEALSAIHAYNPIPLTVPEALFEVDNAEVLTYVVGFLLTDLRFEELKDKVIFFRDASEDEVPKSRGTVDYNLEEMAIAVVNSIETRPLNKKYRRSLNNIRNDLADVIYLGDIQTQKKK